MKTKPIVIAPLYRDGMYFAAGRLGLQPSQVEIITSRRPLFGRNLAEVPVYFLQGNWSSGMKYLEMKEVATARGAKIQWRSL